MQFRGHVQDEMWRENWANRFMRPGLFLIALFVIASVATSVVLYPSLAWRYLPFEIFNVVAAFACLWAMWSARFQHQWREMAFAFSFLILLAASYFSLVTNMTEPLVITILLLLLGAGSLIPWNARWQVGLTLLCIGWFVINAIWGRRQTEDLDRWIAVLVAAALAQVGVARNEDSEARRLVEESAAAGSLPIA
jgi:hypothetical protein